MSRNKHPEETVRKILDVSTRLFLEKGYEKTSMQDIVNALGMSKGAVYHHFKSKEELFEAVVGEFYSQDSWFAEIAKDSSKNGLEKLRTVFRYELGSEEKISVDSMYFNHVGSGTARLKNLRLNTAEGARDISKIIEEGNRDGSLHVKNPREAAEMMLILANVWIAMFADSREKMSRQLDTCATVLESLGMPLFDDGLKNQMMIYYDRVLFPRQPGNAILK